MTTTQTTYVRWFDDLRSDDTGSVGGKNASLGEMIAELTDKGVRLPPGFATTAEAYWSFVDHNGLRDGIRKQLRALDDEERSLPEVGEAIRTMFLEGAFPDEVAGPVREAYDALSERCEIEDVPVAVRSSATAEDLPEASFAGQQESYLNIRGADAVLLHCKKCFASLFTDRAIQYRREQGFDHMKVALSAGVHQVVGGNETCAGVMFTIHTESGFPNVIVINAAWGLGETVVSGQVNPDEYLVFKPLLDEEGATPILRRKRGDKERKAIFADEGDEATDVVETSEDERRSLTLSDEEVLQLARWAKIIEDHYERPMDIEWVKNDTDDELYIVQARPETVQSQKQASSFKAYELKDESEVIVSGVAVGSAIAGGTARVLSSPDERERFEDGDILVTQMTDPDWGPLMERASAIVTDLGGRTAHAAIVSRELGIPAIVGTEEATQAIEDGREVTVSTVGGEQGLVYDGLLDYEAKDLNVEEVPETSTRIMMNIASPAAAFRWHRLPCQGIGLARMEFIIGNIIKVHPLALSRYDELEDEEARRRIDALTTGYDDKSEYFVDQLAQGIAMIAASQHPEPAIVRMSDFKTNEYAGLIGGAPFEPEEANPMLGFRGASRYYSDHYRDGFALECRAIRRVRQQIGLKNVMPMVPFCRSIAEADKVLEVMAEHDLRRGEDGLEIYVMAEIPANVFLGDQFAERFDGFSIGSNDLTQLVLGVDRDSAELAHLFDEQNEAVKRAIRQIIQTAGERDTKVGICGQAPSDHPEFAEFLVRSGIDSISLNPDSVLDAIERVAKVEGGG